MTSLSSSALVRRMTPADLDRVMEIAGSLKKAPQWPRSAYLAALEPDAAPRRIALVAEYPSGAMESHPSDKNKDAARVGHTESMGQSNQVAGFAVASLMPPEAELEIIAVAPAVQRQGLAVWLFEALIAEFAHGVHKRDYAGGALQQPAGS